MKQKQENKPQIKTTRSKRGSYHVVNIEHLPTGIKVEGEGKVFYRLKLDLISELNKLIADSGYKMIKELASPDEIKSKLHS